MTDIHRPILTIMKLYKKASIMVLAYSFTDLKFGSDFGTVVNTTSPTIYVTMNFFMNKNLRT